MFSHIINLMISSRTKSMCLVGRSQFTGMSVEGILIDVTPLKLILASEFGSLQLDTYKLYRCNHHSLGTSKNIKELMLFSNLTTVCMHVVLVLLLNVITGHSKVIKRCCHTHITCKVQVHVTFVING